MNAQPQNLTDHASEQADEHDRYAEPIREKIEKGVELDERDIEFITTQDPYLLAAYNRSEGVKAWQRYINVNGEQSECCGETIVKDCCSSCHEHAVGLSAEALHACAGECEKGYYG
jgi:hypothetical protein